jgi:hypothetical protein
VNPLYVATDGTDNRRCYGDVTGEGTNNNKICATITFASLTPLVTDTYTINVAEGTYHEARITISSKMWVISGASEVEPCLMLSNSHTHVIVCLDTGSLSLDNFTFDFYPIKDVVSNMIHFDSSGTFSFSNCIIRGLSIGFSSNTFVSSSCLSLSFSHCNYTDIEINGSDTGAAIHSEITSDRDFIIEYCQFRWCQSENNGAGICAVGSSMKIEGCLFSYCYSDNLGGAIYVSGGGTLELKNTEMFAGYAYIDGGGIYFKGSVCCIFFFISTYIYCSILLMYIYIYIYIIK